MICGAKHTTLRKWSQQLDQQDLAQNFEEDHHQELNMIGSQTKIYILDSID